WVQQTLPSEAIGKGLAKYISGTPNNVHVVLGDGSGILRFDGTSWNIIYTDTSDLVGPLTLLAPTEGYYVTCMGWGRWNGSNWQFHGRQFDFCDVHGLWGTR